MYTKESLTNLAARLLSTYDIVLFAANLSQQAEEDPEEFGRLAAAVHSALDRTLVVNLFRLITAAYQLEERTDDGSTT